MMYTKEERFVTFKFLDEAFKAGVFTCLEDLKMGKEEDIWQLRIVLKNGDVEISITHDFSFSKRRKNIVFHTELMTTEATINAVVLDDYGKLASFDEWYYERGEDCLARYFSNERPLVFLRGVYPFHAI